MTWILLLWIAAGAGSTTSISLAPIPMKDLAACQKAAEAWGQGACMDQATGEFHVYSKPTEKKQ